MTSIAATMTSGAGRATVRDEPVLRVRAASFPRRFMAALVDGVLLLAVSTAVSIVTALVLGVPLPSSRELGPDLLLAGVLDRHPVALGSLGLLLGLAMLYQVYLGGITGQTVGKRLFRLRVISVRGTAPGPVRGIIRFFALVLATAPAGLGWLWCLFDRERRAVHDHLAGTYVIIEP